MTHYDLPLVVDREPYEDARTILIGLSDTLNRRLGDTAWVSAVITRFPDDWVSRVEPKTASAPSVRITPRLASGTFLRLRTIEHHIQGLNLMRIVRTSQVFNGMLQMAIEHYDLKQWMEKYVSENL